MSRPHSTPGPWRTPGWDPSYDGCTDAQRYPKAVGAIRTPAGLYALTWDSSGSISDLDHAANLRLMAAAPDLYAALDAVMAFLDTGKPEPTADLVVAVRTALAKARGEP